MSTDLVQVGSSLPPDPTAMHLYIGAAEDAPTRHLRALAAALYQGVCCEWDYIIVDLSTLAGIGIGTGWWKLVNCNVWPFVTMLAADEARDLLQKWLYTVREIPPVGAPRSPGAPYIPRLLSDVLGSWNGERDGERWCVVRARDVEVNYPSWRKAKAAIVESTPTVTTVTIIDAATTIDGKVDGVLSADCLHIYQLAMNEQSGYRIFKRHHVERITDNGIIMALNPKQLAHAVWLWDQNVKRRKRWQRIKDEHNAIRVVVTPEVEPWE